MSTTDTNGVIWNARTPFNYDKDAASLATALECKDPTRTQQQFKEEADINVILERFGVTGHLPIVTAQPMSGDFTDVEDFQSALHAVKEAERNFLTLPSKVREQFHHNPQKFVDFCIDPANIEAVRTLGLAPPKPKETNVPQPSNPES